MNRYILTELRLYSCRRSTPVLQFIRLKTTDKYSRDIPSAYKFYKEDTKERHTRKVRKKNPRSSLNSNSSPNNGATESSNNGQPFIAAANGSYSTSKLFAFEKETEKAMQDYMQTLDAPGSAAMNLLNTEDEYAQLCVKLRQTIGRWCSGFGTPTRRKVDDFTTLPPFRAIKFLSCLEHIRKDRERKINYTLKQEQDMKDTKEADTGFMKWIYGKLSGNESDTESEDIIQRLNLLSAHRSGDYTANVRLYLTALLCCRNWSEVIPNPIISSEMEGIIHTMMTNYNDGNPNCKLDIQCYHHLLLHYQRVSGDISIAKKALKILRDLVNDQPLGVTPTQETFHIVLSIYQSVASSKCKDDVKREVVNDAETILSLYENTELENALDTTINQPFNSIFSIFIAVGPSLLPDYLERIHNVMTRLLGQSAYEYLLSNNGALIDLPNVDHKTIHDLIHLLSMSADRDALDKAKILLRKMENTRIAYENKKSHIQWDRKYPRRSSFNSLIVGMFHTSFETSSLRNENEIDDEDIEAPALLDVEDDVKVDIKVNDAIYCTQLLDLMLQRQESIPNAFTYYRIIKMWAVTASKEAGDRGEELLSRLNLFSIFTHDKAPFQDIKMKVKGSVLECWQASANAGRPLAAQRAYNLLCRIYEEENLDLVHDDARGQREKYFLLMKVIGACAHTKLEEDRDNAIDIAVRLHRKMKKEDVPLTPFTYVLLLKCFHGFTTNDEKKMVLSSSLFHQACMDSLVNRHVLNSLKYANPVLFESYQKNPEHSRTFATK
jgi:hypothetical protein